MKPRISLAILLLVVLPSSAAPPDASFLSNGVTAHRGHSGEFPEKTMAGFENALRIDADWIELDVFRTKESRLVVIHDPTTERLGDRNSNVASKQNRWSAKVICEGTYPHHLQGICTDGEAIYWSFTTVLVKTDLNGRLLNKVPVVNHHGDLCHDNGKLYVAVNLGNFNDPNGNADSWVYVYDAATLEELDRHETQEIVYGAGGIGFRNDHFYVVGGLPEGVEENYVCEYDGQFQFVKKHVVASGHTLMGIQTATFAHNRWWFGCYGNPKKLLVTDAELRLLGRYEFDCSLGIEGLSDGRLLSASGRCDGANGCTGSVNLATPDDKLGVRYLQE